MINLLNKLPIPNLRHYCLFSFSLLSLVALYAYKVMYDLRNNVLDPVDEAQISSSSSGSADEPDAQSTSTSSLESSSTLLVNDNSTVSLLASTYRAVANEPWCVWVLINFSYCCLILFSKIIQMVVFGKLRAVENQVKCYPIWLFSLIYSCLFIKNKIRINSNQAV